MTNTIRWQSLDDNGEDKVARKGRDKDKRGRKLSPRRWLPIHIILLAQRNDYFMSLTTPTKFFQAESHFQTIFGQEIGEKLLSDPRGTDPE